MPLNKSVSIALLGECRVPSNPKHDRSSVIWKVVRIQILYHEIYLIYIKLLIQLNSKLVDLCEKLLNRPTSNIVEFHHELLNFTPLISAYSLNHEL